MYCSVALDCLRSRALCVAVEEEERTKSMTGVNVASSSRLVFSVQEAREGGTRRREIYLGTFGTTAANSNDLNSFEWTNLC